jgi:hypothetical protein
MSRGHILWVLAMLAAATPADAQNRGVYPLGMSATNSGVTPDAGFSYANQLLFYSRDRAKDDGGETLPVTGRNAVVMDMNSFIWVSQKKLLGARYSATATLPVAKNNLTSDINGPISGGSGFADSYYLPVILGWDRERVAYKAMYGVLAPTGRFAAEADDNVGSGYWTHTLSAGQTFYLTETGRLVFSAFEMYEFHSTQAETDIHPGENFDLDYSLMGSLPQSGSVLLQVGLVGYLQRQTTAKTGPEIAPAMSEERYAVNALGFALSTVFPRQKANVGVRYFKEFANRSTFEGYSLQVAGAVSF